MADTRSRRMVLSALKRTSPQQSKMKKKFLGSASVKQLTMNKSKKVSKKVKGLRKISVQDLTEFPPSEAASIFQQQTSVQHPLFNETSSSLPLHEIDFNIGTLEKAFKNPIFPHKRPTADDENSPPDESRIAEPPILKADKNEVSLNSSSLSQSFLVTDDNNVVLGSVDLEISNNRNEDEALSSKCGPETTVEPQNISTNSNGSEALLVDPVTGEMIMIPEIELLNASDNMNSDALNGGNEILSTFGDGIDDEMATAFEFTFVKNALYEILSTSADGKRVLNHYKKRKSLNDTKRTLLVDLLIRRELAEDPDHKLIRVDFENIAQNIIQLFPTEKVETYFLGFHKIGPKKQNASGRLWDKYNNLRRAYRNDGVIQKKSKQIEVQKPTFNYNTGQSVSGDQVKFDWDWLKESLSPWQLVLQKWLVTAEKRLSEFDSGNASVSEYFATYPALSNKKKISELIAIDFKVKFQDKDGNSLHNKWPKLQREIFRYTKEKLEDDRHFRATLTAANIDPNAKNDNSKSIIAVLLLTLFIPLPPAVKKQKIKPSKLEARSGFVFHVKSPGCVITEVEEQIKKLRESGHKFIAFCIIVGPNFTEISENYAYFDGKLFPTDGILFSIDLCFKFFMIFNSEFPTEAAHIWTFLHNFVYGFDHQDRSPSQITLAADLKLI